MELNENGLLAAELAEKLLGRGGFAGRARPQLDRSRHTLSVGSCAPEPLWELVAALGSIYPGMTISSGLAEQDALLSGVQDETYSLVVLTGHPELPGVESIPFGSEKLCFLLPMNHPLAGEKELRLADLNGETMLLRPNLGFWTRTLESLPDTHFLVHAGGLRLWRAAAREQPARLHHRPRPAPLRRDRRPSCGAYLGPGYDGGSISSPTAAPRRSASQPH